MQTHCLTPSMPVITTPAKHKVPASRLAARLARFDRLIAEFSATIAQLQAVQLVAPRDKAALTRAENALKRHTRERAEYLQRTEAK